MKKEVYIQLQKRYGGQFIARQNGSVLVHANTYTKLLREIEKQRVDRRKLLVEYVEPRDSICVYLKSGNAVIII